MTKPTGRPRGRPPGSRTAGPPRSRQRDRVSDPETLRKIAHAYFLKLQTHVLTTLLEAGFKSTVDVKYVKRVIGQKLLAEGNKMGYLNQDQNQDQDEDSESLAEINAGDDES